MKHRGKIVEKIIRKSGYSLTALAKKLNISRNTLYNKFEKQNLSYRFIIEIGHIIHHDFAEDFSDMAQEIGLMGEPPTHTIYGDTFDLWKAERKYILLLEKYTQLILTLVKVSNTNTSKKLQEEIKNFLEHDAIN